MALVQPGKWTLGALWNQIWSMDGANDRDDVNQMFLQPFANYNLGQGLAVGAQMEAAANFEADDEQWQSYLLFTLSKVTLLGKRPVSFLAAAGPAVAHPTGRPDWRLRFRRDVPVSALTPVTPESSRRPRSDGGGRA